MRRFSTLLTVAALLLLGPILNDAFLNFTPRYRLPVTDTAKNGTSVAYSIKHQRIMHVNETTVIVFAYELTTPPTVAVVGTAHVNCNFQSHAFKLTLIYTDSSRPKQGECDWLATPLFDGLQDISLDAPVTVSLTSTKGPQSSRPHDQIVIDAGRTSSSEIDTYFYHSIEPIRVWKAWLGPDSVSTSLAILAGVVGIAQVLVKHE